MLTFKPWKIESALQMLLGLFGGISFTGFLAYALGYRPVPGQINHVMLIVGAVGFHGVGLLWLHWLVRDHEFTWRGVLGLDSRSLGWAAILGIAVGVMGFFGCNLLNGLVIEVLARFGRQPEAQSTVMALQSTPSPAWMIAFGVISIGLAPLVEEVIFRGLLFSILKQLGLPWLAWWGTAILFALSHANLQAFLPLMVLALALAWLYDRTDNLMASVLAHATFNGINFVMAIRFGALAHGGGHL